MTCTPSHHPLVAGGFAPVHTLDPWGPPGQTWASRCFGVHCMHWNVNAEQVIVDGPNTGTLTVFNAPFRLRVEDRPAVWGAMRTVSISKDAPDGMPTRRIGCNVITGNPLGGGSPVDAPFVVFLNGDARVALPDGRHPYTTPEVMRARHEVYERLARNGAASVTEPSEIAGWFSGLAERMAAAFAAPRPVIGVDPASGEASAVTFADIVSMGAPARRQLVDGLPHPVVNAATAEETRSGDYVRKLFARCREVSDRAAAMPRMVVNPATAEQIASAFGQGALVNVVVSPHAPADHAYMIPSGQALGILHGVSYDHPPSERTDPSPRRPSPRPSGVTEWGLVLVELREHARRMGTHLIRTGERRLFHGVEVAVGIEPGRVEKIGLKATRSPDSGVVRVRGDRDLGILWSSDPFALLGHGGKGNGDDTFWGDHLIRDAPEFASVEPRPERRWFRFSGLRVEGTPGEWTSTMADRQADQLREGGA